MALRIHTNTAAISVLRSLRAVEMAQDRSMVRLSTGLRINSAADDPAGLVQANRFRSQLAGLEQALQNTRTDNNLLATADSGLGQIEELLDSIRTSVLFALNGGGADPDLLAAEQDSVDQALAAIDRIANTTKFGGRSLLDGSVGNIPTNQSNEITQIFVQNVSLPDPTTSQTFTVTVVTTASQAVSDANFAAQTDTAIIRISGNLGSEDLALGSTTTLVQVQSSINALRFNTGVYVSGDNIVSLGYGSDQFVRLEEIAGTYNGTDDLSDFGVDMAAYVNGQQTSARGSVITVNSPAITAAIEIDPTAAAGAYTFAVSPKRGLSFQLNDGPGASGGEQLGLAAADSASLGTPVVSASGTAQGGFLATLGGGLGNDLVTNAQNALRIVDAASSMLADLRAYIGSFQSNVLQRQETVLGVHIENLSAAESDIRDVDFAAETTEFTKNQILFQAGTAVLAQANLIPQAVLTLLQR